MRGLLVRTQGAPESLLNSVRREIWALDRNVALTNTGTLNEFLKQFSYAEPFGIRMALGAGRGDVMRMVVRMGLQLVAIGVAIGLGASLAVTRVIASQIWGVSPHDPLTIAAVVAVMTLAAAAACYFPARRAMKVDPMVALRYE